MKNYKNVEMFAKNAPCGSYAAGCPTGRIGNGGNVEIYTGDFHNDYQGYRSIGGRYPWHCEKCEIAG